RSDRDWSSDVCSSDLAHEASHECLGRDEVADHPEEDIQKARSLREDMGGEVRETAVRDDELERARHPCLAAEGQAPGAAIGGEGLPRTVAAAERSDRRLHRELGAAERGVDPLAREWVDE